MNRHTIDNISLCSVCDSSDSFSVALRMHEKQLQDRPPFNFLRGKGGGGGKGGMSREIKQSQRETAGDYWE